MTGINLENLYFDSAFDDYVSKTARKNLLEYDDFKQDVFLEITEARARTIAECMTIVRRIRDRTKTANMRERTVSLDEIVDNGYDIADTRDYETSEA